MTARDAIVMALKTLQNQQIQIVKEMANLSACLEAIANEEAQKAHHPTRKNHGATSQIRQRLKTAGPQTTVQLAEHLQSLGIQVAPNKVYMFVRASRDMRVKNNLCSIRAGVEVRPYIIAQAR